MTNFDELVDFVAVGPTEEETALIKLREYYEGRQFEDFGDKADYLSESLKAVLLEYPIANICKTAVASVTERLGVTGWQPKGEQGTQFAVTVQDWWLKRELESWQGDLLRFVMRDKAAAVIVSWGADGMPVFDVNELWDGSGSSGVRLWHSTSGKPILVSKQWAETDALGVLTGRYRLTVYEADAITRMVADGPGSEYRLLEQGELEPGLSNPQPLILADGSPVGILAVPFYNTGYESEVDAIMAPQEMLNENVLSWFTSGQMHGFPSLVIEGEFTPERNPTTGKIVPLKTGPGKLWKTGGAPLKRIEAANMSGIFDGIVRPAIELAAFNKRWPLHLLSPNVLPASGELVRQLEGPFVSQVEEKQRMLGDSFTELMSVARNLGRLMGATFPDGNVVPEWKPATRFDPLYELSVIEKKKSVGNLPDEFVWQLMGYDAEQIKLLTLARNAQVEQRMQVALGDTVNGVTQ